MGIHGRTWENLPHIPHKYPYEPKLALDSSYSISGNMYF